MSPLMGLVYFSLTNFVHSRLKRITLRSTRGL